MISNTPGTREYIASDLGTVKPAVLIGGKDSVVGDKFVPNVNMSFECFSKEEKYFINLNRKDIVVTTESENLSEELSLTVGTETHVWKTWDDGIKWDISFASKPTSNVLSWELLHSSELIFAYQGELTEDEKNGDLPLGGYCHRPDNVVGSYAVYARGKSGNYPDVKYFTGKLCHIYRPQVTDDAGKSEWCDLSITKDTLKITIPQTFLDVAKYPVRLDPDFGYTDEGASERTYAANYTIFSQADGLAPSGDATDIKVYARADSGTVNLDAGLYDYSQTTGIPGTRRQYTSGNTVNADTTMSLRTFDITD